MKYKLLLISLLVSQVVFSQMKTAPFVFGPKIGLQANNLKIYNNSDGTTTKLQMQYHAGVFGRFSMGKFSLQPEAIFQIKGSSLSSPDEKHTYRYISTPILLGIQPIKGLTFEIGPEFSWALNQGWKKDGVQQFGPDALMDKALVLGTRIDLLDMFSMFSVNIRYVQGMDDVTTSGTDLNNATTYRNRTVQLGITYNFSEYYKWWKKHGVKKKK
ncbi:PorT family protein [Arcticibacterium luteifluviistationis]|nr:PorT family protein [Arcticibacterium luteifluviistationis]